MVNYNQAYLPSLVKPGSTRLSILVDNCQKPGKSGSTRVYQAHEAFTQTFGARAITVRPNRVVALFAKDGWSHHHSIWFIIHEHEQRFIIRVKQLA